MTRPFSTELKQRLVARLIGVNAVSAAQLARETGITQQNLSRWLSEARCMPFVASDNQIAAAWTVEQKARIIADAAARAGDDLTHYLESEGVKLAQFKSWRLALEEAGEESVSIARRIGKLERDLTPKGESPRRSGHSFGASRAYRKPLSKGGQPHARSDRTRGSLQSDLTLC